MENHLSGRMEKTFGHALNWHMDQHGTRIVDLVSQTGVSRDVINKLKKGTNQSTTVENAILIAAFYGKSVNDFLQCRDASKSGRITALLDLLSPEEQQLVEAQLRGLLGRRDEE